ncbi:hypothetical protein V3H18_00105 [Methylocystis sp. 9N]|uniref:Uncharacterized protein n=1 Tax=Methylocystis borbori TaxID=3118750 RepID=A0ABU7XCV5_9HYPH
MAVSLRDREFLATGDDIETRARYAWSDIEEEWRAAPSRPRGAQQQAQTVERDLNFERMERLLYVCVGMLVLLGSGIVIGSSFRRVAPENAETAIVAPAPETLAPAAPVNEMRTIVAESTDLRSGEEATIPPASLAAAPAAPLQEGGAAQDEGPASAAAPAAAFEAGPVSEGATEPAPSQTASAARDEAPTAAAAKAAPEGRAGKCLVKISGRVVNSGACRISSSGAAVTFQYSGQTATLSPVKGKTWSLTLGGKKLGPVYKSGGCWASRQAYICERG